MTATTSSLPDRALRADAQRNLLRVLEAARSVFAEQGADASVTEIAERAGVGVATIFRRFPTKSDLLVAVLERRFQDLLVTADEALARPDAEPAFRAFLQAVVGSVVADRGFCDCVGTELVERSALRSLGDELRGRTGAILQRAQAAGAVRADVDADDIRILAMAVAQAGLTVEPARPGAWSRHLDIVLDGLRPTTA